MKELYFTSDSLEKKGRQLLDELKDYRRNRAIKFVPERSALLVLDLQRYFLEPASHAFIPSAAAILPGISTVIGAYQERNLPVFFTRHLNSTRDSGQMKRWWPDLIRARNPLSEITPQLDPTKGLVLAKTQYDAFYGTPLTDWLKNRSVNQVVVSGVMTHLCCETTARSAFMRGFEVFFLVDGTATQNEAFHRAALLNLTHGFATLVLVRDLLMALQGVKDGS
jgi:isochorismate hydrolase